MFLICYFLFLYGWLVALSVHGLEKQVNNILSPRQDSLGKTSASHCIVSIVTMAAG